MTNKLFILFGIVFLFLVGTVTSVSPFISSDISSSPSLQIVFPQLEYHPFGANFKLNFHVFNSSSFPLDNRTTNCTIHVYNITGDHILKTKGVFGDEADFEYTINTSVIRNRGYYSYVMWCNTNSEFGYVASYFRVTETGIEPSVDSITTIVGLLLILVFFAALSFWLNSKENYLWYLFFFLCFLWVNLILFVLYQFAFSGLKVYATLMLGMYRFSLVLTIFMFFLIIFSITLSLFNHTKKEGEKKSNFKDNLL